jgi:glucan-binding YG repeat protein
MNKNLKRIVAIALAIGTVSAIAPATNFNLLTTKAYASNSDADELDSVELQDDDGDTIDLYTDDDYDDELDDDLEVGETYYAESSTDQVSIDSIDGADEDNVRIFVGSDDYEVGDSIDLDDEITTLKVRVYEDEYDDDEDYSSSDYNQYSIKVEYTEYDDDENDEDTLDSLELLDEDSDTIDLYEDDDYEDDIDSDDVEEGETYYAKTSSDEVSIEIEGPDEDYVKVFKSTSDSAKGIDPGDSIYIAGDKTLTVRIYSEEPDSDVRYEDDDDVIGEYEIELEYTAKKTSTGTSTTNITNIATSKPTTATDITTTKTNQWIKVNGSWQYNDGMGNTVKNSWVEKHYLKDDGNMATGWLNYNDKWYYLGSDGIIKTGWQSIGEAWYYLDSEGAIQTGWIKDTNENYYYLYTNGAMAYNTTIQGYKLASTGEWSK